MLSMMLVLILAAPIFEYGNIQELRGVTAIYIDAGSDLEIRQNMIKTITKELPALAIVSRPEEATVALSLFFDSDTSLSGIYSATVGSSVIATPQYRTIGYGTGVLIMRGSGPDRIRVLAQFKQSRGTIFERRTSTNIARDFIKAYRKANGTK